MTSAIASWIEELAKPAFRAEWNVVGSDAKGRQRRDAIRAFENSLPPLYRWARLDHPLLKPRVKLERIPSEPPNTSRVVFLGPAGAGKTSLALALLRAMFERELASAPLESDDASERIVRRYRFAHAHRISRPIGFLTHDVSSFRRYSSDEQQRETVFASVKQPTTVDAE